MQPDWREVGLGRDVVPGLRRDDAGQADLLLALRLDAVAHGTEAGEGGLDLLYPQRLARGEQQCLQHFLQVKSHAEKPDE